VVLVIVRLSELAKNLTYSSLAVGLAFAVAYVLLLSSLGYVYELHVVSTIVFTSLGVGVTLGLLRRRVGGSRHVYVSGSGQSVYVRESGGKARPVEVIEYGTGRMYAFLTVMVAVVLAEELLLNSVYAVYGLVLAILGFLSLPVFAVVLGKRNDWFRAAVEAVALVFATRVVLSPFPSGFLSLSLFLPSIYTLILMGVVVYLAYRGVSARNVRISLGRYPLRLQLGVGLGIGSVLGSIEYFVLRPQPILQDVSLLQILAYTVIVMMVFVGVTEEFLFRGLLQASLERAMPAWQAIGVTSVIFGLMHIGWFNPLEVLLAYSAGVVFGYMATVTDSLIAPITAHGFGNVVLYLIALYPL